MIQSQTDDPPITLPRLSPPSPASAAADSLDDDSDGSFEVVIRPRSGWIAIDFKELWEFRELLWFLIWRDISVRYKQTVLGSAWAVVQPLMLMTIFTVIFGRFAKIDSQGFDYPVFVFAGLIPWTMFSQGFPQSALSLVNQHQLMTKAYFPWIYIPFAAAAVFLVNMIVSLLLYALILTYYGVVPSWTIVCLPLLMLLTLIATLSIGLFLSALTVFYRDFRHVVPFLTQIFMYVTPVIYPAHLITRPLVRWILSLNPMFGIVTAFRSAILGLPWDLTCLAISTVSALGGFLFSVYYFRRTEREFADFA